MQISRLCRQHERKHHTEFLHVNSVSRVTVNASYRKHIAPPPVKSRLEII